MSEFRKMRRFKQAISPEECAEVLRTSPRGIMAFHGENGYPYAIPLNFFFDPEDGKLYFHGAREGLKLDLIQQDNRVCFTVLDSGFRREGEWALNIKSVVCLGCLEILTDRDKALEQCRKLAMKYHPSREEAEEELKRSFGRANVLVLTVDRMTGKLVNES